MVETDGILMATGASRTNNIEQLVEETAALAAAYELPLWPHSLQETEGDGSGRPGFESRFPVG